MPSAPIRIAIVDDHPMIRRGVRLTFSDHPDFEIVGEGASSADAAAIADTAAPDILLLDVSMPGGGLEACQDIGKRHPALKIAVMTVFDDLPTVQRALKIGAAGYILKDVDGDELVGCVRRILKGERYISPGLAARLLQLAPGNEARASRQDETAVTLTPREKELLSLLGEGLTNAEIAKRTGLADTTVKQYVSLLIQKLGVRNRTAAALLARSSGN